MLEELELASNEELRLAVEDGKEQKLNWRQNMERIGWIMSWKVG